MAVLHEQRRRRVPDVSVDEVAVALAMLQNHVSQKEGLIPETARLHPEEPVPGFGSGRICLELLVLALLLDTAFLGCLAVAAPAAALPVLGL